MKTPELDWRLHVPMVFKVLKDLKYLETRGVKLYMIGFTIYRQGGHPYCPSEIHSFDDAISVLGMNGANTTPHWEAICLLKGVTSHSVLERGYRLLAKLFPTAVYL